MKEEKFRGSPICCCMRASILEFVSAILWRKRWRDYGHCWLNVGKVTNQRSAHTLHCIHRHDVSDIRLTFSFPTKCHFDSLWLLTSAGCHRKMLLNVSKETYRGLTQSHPNTICKSVLYKWAQTYFCSYQSPIVHYRTLQPPNYS